MQSLIDTPPGDAKQSPQIRLLASFLLATLLLTLLGTVLPPRWKLYGLYPFVSGVGIGLAAERWFTPLATSRLTSVVCWILAACFVWNGQHLILYRSYSTTLAESFARDPSSQWGIELQQSQPPSSQESRSQQANADYHQELQRIERIRNELRSFPAYLKARAKPVGIRSLSAAWGLYFLEMLACIAGALSVPRLARFFCSSNQAPSPPIS